MIKIIQTSVLVLSSLALFACNDKGELSKTEKASSSVEQNTVSDYPTQAPALGTKIEEMKRSGFSPVKNSQEYRELDWEELSPEGYQQNKIIDKYQPQIDATPEGSPEEDAIFQKMMAELDSAPANDKLDGQKIKLPGFVSPLEEVNGKVSEFLLVPYFGACIHVPPPPLNNTLLIKTKPDYAIDAEKTYLPVWVIGKIQVKSTTTDIASAGYLIEDAMIEPYEEEEEAAGEEVK